MATFSDSASGISNILTPYVPLLGGATYVVQLNGSTELVIEIDGDLADCVITLTGTSLAYTPETGLTGTITGLAFSFDGVPQYAVTGANVSAASVSDYIYETGELEFVVVAMYSGADTFNIDEIPTGDANEFYGLGGPDTFNFGDNWSNASFSNATVDGGAGNDTLVLSGLYASTIYIFEDDNVVDLETVILGAGNSYTIALRDAAGYGNLTINGSALLSNNSLTVGRLTGEDDTTGLYTILGGAGADTLGGSDKTGAGDTISGNGGADDLFGNGGNDTLNGGGGNDQISGGLGADSINGGANNDTIDLRDGGADVANGSTGNDTFLLAFGNNGFEIEGGAGNDTIVVSGTLASAAISGDVTNVETIDINVNGDVTLTIGNTVVAAGATLTVDATGLNNASEDFLFNGTAELNGRLIVRGGAGADTITGGGVVDTLQGNGGADVLNGGKGSDVLTGGASSDIFLFKTALGASNVDQITDYNVAADTIRLENAIFKTLANGALNATAFWKGNAAHDANDRIIYNAATGALLFDQDGTGNAHAAVRFATLSSGLNLTAADFVVI